MRARVCVGLLLVVSSVATAENPPAVSVRDVPNTNGAWQEARGFIDAPPDVVHRWIADYAHWPDYCGDVKTAIVLGREENGGATLVRMRSRIFNAWLTIKVRRMPFGYLFNGRAGSITTEGKVW